MVKYTVLHKQPKRTLGTFFRSVPTASTPDSRWGLVQICLSLFFFFFGLAIVAIQFYGTPLWGCPLMTVAIVLGLLAVIMIVITISLGWHYWSKQEIDSPILIVTKDSQLKIDPTNVLLNTDNSIKITTDKLLIQIKTIEREGDKNATHK